MPSTKAESVANTFDANAVPRKRHQKSQSYINLINISNYLDDTEMGS